ncbi:helix-turn-helix domain-containing protein [Sporosarcina cascadiensis]|uniref:helix-turn-helix domain-containing protein n=1 Tax=Sporosarcina cascadiensis TaxID=2660747 RepID=UPI00129BE628|nr:helix-turn-helix transcriptional regulator [Sporosarcina cascadiensis]
MKWADYKKQITALTPREMSEIEIVAQLISRRIQLGLTQQEVADRAGLKQAAIARLEKEHAIPRLDTLEKVAAALGLRIALIEDSLYETESSSVGNS